MLVLGATAADAADMSAFKSWATSNGVSTAKVNLSAEMGPGLRGVVAATDVLVRVHAGAHAQFSSRLNPRVQRSTAAPLGLPLPRALLSQRPVQPAAEADHTFASLCAGG